MLLPLLQNNLLQGGSDVEVGVSVASLSLTTHAATISYDINVAVNAASLTLTTYPATVALDVAVNANAASLTLATHAATISYDVNVSAATAGLSLTTYSATVDTGDVNVAVGISALSLTTYPATVDATDAVIREQASSAGGWGFLNLYDAERQRRRARARRRKDLEEESERIENAVEREIARLLRKQEAEDDRRQELQRLAELARADADIEAARQYSERVATAYARALAKGNYSALEALERELRRAAEEEEWLLNATMALLN